MATKLTPLQIKQKDFILQEYPMLDETIADTIVRLSPEDTETIANKIKSGELKLEEPMDAEKYTIQSVKVE
jgi:hypothetical protein